jgi:hypothetical protein
MQDVSLSEEASLSEAVDLLEEEGRLLGSEVRVSPSRRVQILADKAGLGLCRQGKVCGHAVKEGSGLYRQSKCPQGMFWVVPSRQVPSKQVPSKQVRPRRVLVLAVEAGAGSCR